MIKMLSRTIMNKLKPNFKKIASSNRFGNKIDV